MVPFFLNPIRDVAEIIKWSVIGLIVLAMVVSGWAIGHRTGHFVGYRRGYRAGLDQCGLGPRRIFRETMFSPIPDHQVLLEEIQEDES